MREGLAARPDDAALLYNAACYESLSGRQPDALAYLLRAVEIDPRYAGYAAGDADLTPLRDDPAFPVAPE